MPYSDPAKKRESSRRWYAKLTPEQKADRLTRMRENARLWRLRRRTPLQKATSALLDDGSRKASNQDTRNAE